MDRKSLDYKISKYRSKLQSADNVVYRGKLNYYYNLTQRGGDENIKKELNILSNVSDVINQQATEIEELKKKLAETEKRATEIEELKKKLAEADKKYKNANDRADHLKKQNTQCNLEIGTTNDELKKAKQLFEKQKEQLETQLDVCERLLAVYK